MYRKIFKHCFDFIISLLGFILLSPLFVLLWIMIVLANKGGGAFFIQERPGKDMKIFKAVKFKTMKDTRDKYGRLLPDEQRLTKFGKFIRSTSLDELPQLLNVIKGEMSIIGPRPLLVSYLPLYNKMQLRRHEVKPGITGWAQVNGRNAINWQKKFEFDVWYVDNLSFSLDVRIIALTIKKIINREGINSASSATMEAFEGTDNNVS